MTPVELSCENLSVTYRSSRMTVEALHEVAFTLSENEFVCVVGPSGCGKSTLLRTIAGLIQPSAGRVVFHDHAQRAQSRCAMVFQDHGVFPWMTVLDNVAFALEMQGIGRKERHARARRFLDKIGLAEFAGAYPHELSGGMRQRVAILRAFLANPQILLMDEPFGALDSQTRLVMQEELLRIWKDHRKTVVYVTHDIEEAILLGDRVLVMSGRPGRIRMDIQIPLERPRHLANRDHPEVAEIRWQIWSMLEVEVRRELGIPA
jgi:NitT/TauT family transport system ATP-binding protein